MTTCGLPIVSSKPSRRICSTSTSSWSSPRPCTSQVSGRSVGRTRSETLPTSSERSRASTQARGHLVALAPGERRGVDPDRHRERRLVDRDHRQRPRVVRIGERLADRHLGDAGDGDDLAGAGLLGLDAVERLGHVQLRHLRPLDRPVGAAPGDLLRAPDRPLLDAAEREPADVRRGVEVRDERLERMALLVGRRRDALDDQVEERLEVGRERVRVGPGACPARALQ